MNIIFYLFQELKLLNSCNILLHLLRIHLICATLHLHQISGTIFSLCFNAHGNPHPGFHFWISLLFQQRIHSDFWWCYSFTATLSDPYTCISCMHTGQMLRYFWNFDKSLLYRIYFHSISILSFYTYNVKIYSESF